MATTRRTLTTVPADRVTVAPSVLAADFARLGEEVTRVTEAGADVIHIDVMDGHFVPNLSMGPAVVQAIRPCSGLPFDVHLMLSEPDRYVQSFVKAGADHVTVHVEIEGSIPAVLAQIRELGCSTGLSLRPGTSAERLLPYLRDVDLILVMSVEPGFGGQSFRTDVIPKIARIREMIAGVGRAVHLEVDGGIGRSTVGSVVAAGANMLVAGTSVFRAPEGMAAAVAALRAARGPGPA